MVRPLRRALLRQVRVPVTSMRPSLRTTRGADLGAATGARWAWPSPPRPPIDGGSVGTDNGIPPRKGTAMFGKSWEPAEATIVLVNTKYVSGSGMTSIQEWAADVRKADGTVVRAKIDEPRIATNFWAPVVGDVVKVEVDAKSGKVRFDMDDPKVNAKARKRAKEDAFAAALDQPPGTPTAAPVPGVATPGVGVASGNGRAGGPWTQRRTGRPRSWRGARAVWSDLRDGGEDARGAARKHPQGDGTGASERLAGEPCAGSSTGGSAMAFTCGPSGHLRSARAAGAPSVPSRWSRSSRLATRAASGCELRITVTCRSRPPLPTRSAGFSEAHAEWEVEWEVDADGALDVAAGASSTLVLGPPPSPKTRVNGDAFVTIRGDGGDWMMVAPMGEEAPRGSDERASSKTGCSWSTACCARSWTAEPHPSGAPQSRACYPT